MGTVYKTINISGSQDLERTSGQFESDVFNYKLAPHGENTCKGNKPW